jgi:hypothetical protein
MLDAHPKRVNVGCAGDVLLAVVAIILVLTEPGTPPLTVAGTAVPATSKPQ